MYDAIVIGGGVVGMSAAYHLARNGVNALLIDRHHVGRATDAGAGILSPETSGVGIHPAWFEFGVQATAYYKPLIEQLHQEQDGDTGYAVCGKLTVAVSEDEIEPFQHAQKVVFERQLQRGTPATDDLYVVSSEEAQAIFPLLAPVHGAFYYKHGARVDGRMLNQAMANAAQIYKLKHINSTVDELIIENGQVIGIVADGETFKSNKIIIAGGAWSQYFGDQLGVYIPVEPKRGQIIHLDLPDFDTATFPVITAFHGHYMVPWADNRIAVGATRELNTGFNPVPTVAGMQEVFREAVRVAPALASAQFREIRVGLRPHTVDSLPVLGEVPNVSNLFLATGHGATGLQLGPYSGKLASDWAMGKLLETDISAFHISRFNS